MTAAFDVSCIAPVGTLPALDPMSVPEANSNCINHGEYSINVAFEFYSNSKEDMSKGHTKISPPLLNYTKESLHLEYAGYENYVCTHSLELTNKSFGSEKY